MNIAIIRGGHDTEHEISLLSGQTCIEALRGDHTVVDVVIDRSLRTWNIDSVEYTPVQALTALKDSVEVALLMLHGPFGEDGVIQGALETAGIAYTGSDVRASALAMDKFAANHIFANLNGFNVPDFALLNTADLDNARQIIERLGFPLVIKPTTGGSSVEVYFVDTYEEMLEKLRSAKSTSFIAQRVVDGTEVTCGVLDTEGPTTALEVIEIIPPNEDGFFDYEAKYTAGASQEILPARISSEANEQIQRMSVMAHRLLGCRGITRSDFILDQNGTVWFLEINTAPGMTKTSLVPQEIEAAGLRLQDVLINACAQGADR